MDAIRKPNEIGKYFNEYTNACGQAERHKEREGEVEKVKVESDLFCQAHRESAQKKSRKSNQQIVERSKTTNTEKVEGATNRGK